MILEGIYRRFVPLRVAKGTIDARFTFTESLAVGQVEPDGWEMSRAGRRFHLAYNGTVPTGIAPVQAMPTTVTAFTIWNADPSKSYGFTVLGALTFSGTPAVTGGVLLATIFQAPVQLGANLTGVAIMSASNGGPASKAIVKGTVTITGPAVPVWAPVADQQASGPPVNRQLNGRVLLAPGQGLGLTVLAAVGTTPLFLPVAEWIELETDQE
jgi:hypothetical protein